MFIKRGVNLPLFSIGKKKEPQPPVAGPGPIPGQAQGTPMDQVLALRQQGIPDDQIISQLQQSGLSQEQVYNAMSQADIGNTAGLPPQGGPPPMDGPMPGNPPPMGEPGAMPPMEAPMGGPPMMEPHDTGHNMAAGDKAMIEELTEAIIDEKWNCSYWNFPELQNHFTSTSSCR